MSVFVLTIRTITCPSGSQNTSYKCTSRFKSICLKDTLVTGALLRNSAVGSRRATTIMFRYTLNSYSFSKTYSSEQLKLSFMYYHSDKPKWFDSKFKRKKDSL